MKNNEDKEQITDPTMNIVFIFDFQKSNNCKSVGFGMQKSTNDMLGILTKSGTIFVRSLGIFTQSSKF
jgi:hypothetical protein